MFPRSDTLHALVAGPPIFVAGAYALARVWYFGAAAHLLAALAIVPVVAIAPVGWRLATVVGPEKCQP